MRRVIASLFLLTGVGSGLFWLMTVPASVDPTRFAGLEGGAGVATRGERLFWVGGCASCHAAAGARGDQRLVLGGGAPLKTPFGSFVPPNISPHPQAGIGAWSLVDFANAMQRGVDPEGNHLYPAFPYTSYARMPPSDIADLFAYLRTLPPVATVAPANDLAFPYNIRRGIGLWKLAFAGNTHAVITLPANAPIATRDGKYLVEGPGHCGQCHTPRGLGGLGGLDRSRWLGGAPALEAGGRSGGRVPNITPSKDGIAAWSAGEIAYYFETGFTPDYDSVGGTMADVQRNLAMLPREDRAAIAAYLKAVPPVAKAK